MAFYRLTLTHPRLTLATLVGLLGGWLIPADDWTQRFLTGWNLGVWLYLALVLWLTWRATSQTVRKVANIETTRPDVIASGNFGCVGNIASGTDIPIVHTVELLDWATGGSKPRALKGALP